MENPSLMRPNEIIYLAGGCFWCTEAVFQRVEGVLNVESGYANGHVINPSYEEVCGGDTGHAEAIKITFDSAQIKLQEILDIFFATHNPTTLNQQGNDVGTQYRSGIYFVSEDQEKIAKEKLLDFEKEMTFGAPVVTEVLPLQSWWPAEEYHREYFKKNPYQSYCAYVVVPKVKKLMDVFPKHVKNK